MDFWWDFWGKIDRGMVLGPLFLYLISFCFMRNYWKHTENFDQQWMSMEENNNRISMWQQPPETFTAS